jgi:hypothetical protein
MRKLVLLALTLNLITGLTLPALAQPGPSFGGEDEVPPPSRPSKYSSAADDDYIGSPPPRRTSTPSQAAAPRLTQPVNSAKIMVPAFVTYWTHDGLGYHPSISLNVQNDTGQNLVGQTVQMQAHFMLLSEGISTISRWQTSFDLIGGIQQVNTEAHGKRPFELPIDPNEWPLIECKVLCKIGDNPGQTVLITRIQAVAMNDDEARSALNNQLSRYRLNKYKVDTQRKKDALAAKNDPRPAPVSNATTAPKPVKQPRAEAPPQPEKPLTAVAASFSNPIASGTNSAAPVRENLSGSAVEAFIGKVASQPGLSDDFYLFEKLYGLPVQTDVKDKNWVWAEYRKTPGTRVLAGSKGRTGKADTVIAVIKQDNLSDAQTVNCIKAIAGKFKSEKLSPLEHSVRYVDTSISASGRLELTQLSGQSFRGLSFRVREPDGTHSTAVAVSRLPGALFEQIKAEGHTTDLLNFLLPSLGEQEARQSPSRATSKDGDDDY